MPERGTARITGSTLTPGWSGYSSPALPSDDGGQLYPGGYFDGVNFRGIQLASDDNMVPDTREGMHRQFTVFPEEHPGLVPPERV